METIRIIRTINLNVSRLYFSIYEPSIFNNNREFYSKIFEEVMIVLTLSQTKEEDILIKLKGEYYILFILNVLLKNSSCKKYISKPSIKMCFVLINGIFYTILNGKKVEPQETELLFEAMIQLDQDNLSEAVLKEDYKVNYYIIFRMNLILYLQS